mmetsp:Transcript_65496/g.203105  ORF Transcript_65496/g.203105 Transcript_65496/m.203105 type:complete len:269 (-) Transcript_65496:224-1030(-)
MTHQSLVRYVGPQSITSCAQPLRKTGRQRRSASMLFWSMQYLSIQTVGSRAWRWRKAERQLCSAVHLAAESSCQEWLTNASHFPNLVGMVSAKRLGLGLLSTTSSCVTLARLTQRKRAFACTRASSTVQSPTRPAMPAAEACATCTCRRRCSLACSAWRHSGRRTTRKAAWPPSTHHQEELKAPHSTRMSSDRTKLATVLTTTQRAMVSHMRACMRAPVVQRIASAVAQRKSSMFSPRQASKATCFAQLGQPSWHRKTLCPQTSHWAA